MGQGQAQPCRRPSAPNVAGAIASGSSKRRRNCGPRTVGSAGCACAPRPGRRGCRCPISCSSPWRARTRRSLPGSRAGCVSGMRSPRARRRPNHRAAAGHGARSGIRRDRRLLQEDFVFDTLSRDSLRAWNGCVGRSIRHELAESMAVGSPERAEGRGGCPTAGGSRHTRSRDSPHGGGCHLGGTICGHRGRVQQSPSVAAGYPREVCLSSPAEATGAISDAFAGRYERTGAVGCSVAARWSRSTGPTRRCRRSWTSSCAAG